MSEPSIPEPYTDESGYRVCPDPECGAEFDEDYGRNGELLTDNYGNHWRQWHAPHRSAAETPGTIANKQAFGWG